MKPYFLENTPPRATCKEIFTSAFSNTKLITSEAGLKSVTDANKHLSHLQVEAE